MGGVLSTGRGFFGADHGGSGGRKKPKTSKLPCTSQFYHCPDFVHDTIASCLTNKDVNHLVGCGMWLMEVYGGRITSLNLCGTMKGCPDHEIILSFIKRRPSVVSIKVDRSTSGLLAECIGRGYCTNKIETLEIALGQGSNKLCWKKAEEFEDLCRVLGDGACPNMTRLMFEFPAWPMYIAHVMGKALRSRMANEKGCCGLKSLTIRGCYVLPLISALVTSGACEALQHLEINPSRRYYSGEHWGWLPSNNAPQLVKLILRDPTPDLSLTVAFCCFGMAAKLQELRLVGALTAPQVVHLTNAFIIGAWPELMDLTLSLDSGEGTTTSRQALVEAISRGAPKLVTLYVNGDGLDREGVIRIAAALARGAWPKLRALLLWKVAAVGSEEVMRELCEAFQGDVCNRSLRGLVLACCGINPQAIQQLGEAVDRGGLCNLRYLELSLNSEMGDEGVVSLSKTVTSGGGLRHLRSLELESVGMTDEEARALFEGLGDRRVCPELERLSVGFNGGASEDVKGALVEEMHARRGPKKVHVDWWRWGRYVWTDQDFMGDMRFNEWTRYING